MDKGEVVYVIRNLPFNLEKEKFSSSISSAFSEETIKIIEYIQGKKGTKEIIPTRCYVKIFNKVGTKSSDSFLDFMDGKAFVNSKGIEEQCSVESVPFYLNVNQPIKKNTAMGTLESSKTYQSFLKQLDLPTDSVQNFDTKGNTTQESWPIVDMILKRDNKKDKREKKDRGKKREKKRKRQKRQKQKQKKLLQKQQQESTSTGGISSSTPTITTILSPSSSSSSISTSNSSQNLNNSGNKQSRPKRPPREKKPRKPKEKSINNNTTTTTTTTTTLTSNTSTSVLSSASAPTTPSKSNKAPKEKKFREKKQTERKPKLVYEPKIKQPSPANPPPPST